MISIRPEDIIEWNGFEIYDAETGEYLCPCEVAEKSFPEDRGLPLLVNGFCLTWEGFLYLTREDGGTNYIPRENNYLIQINGKGYMRW